MREEARIQEVINLIETYERSLVREGTTPVESLIRQHFRSRRYAGSKDRRAVGAYMFSFLRKRLQIFERLEKAGALPTPRLITALFLTLDGLDAEKLFSGQGHAPKQLNAAEWNVLETALAVENLSMAAQYNIPTWALEKLINIFSENLLEGELDSLNKSPGLTLRVNSLKAASEKVMRMLQADGIRAIPGRYSPLALYIEGRPNIANHPVITTGLADIQDESGQIAIHCLDLKPGMQVLDLCAGAGGKALAMAAALEGKGQILATDIDQRRMKDLKPRANRAGAHNIQAKVLPEKGEERQKVLAELKGQFDLVLVDAPCTGSGTWARHPDSRFHFQNKSLKYFSGIQDYLLEEASSLVKRGGKIAYMTCSLFGEENRMRMDAFLEKHEGWSLAPLKSEGLVSVSDGLNDDLSLWPGRDGTDGFYCALLAQKSK